MLRMFTVCHRLNLVLNDAAECRAEMKAFLKWWMRSTFCSFQWPELSSTESFWNRCKLKSLTLKRLSSTRWECRHKSVITLINQYLALLEPLHHLNFTSNYGKFRQNSGQIADKCHKSSFWCRLQTTTVKVSKPVLIIRTSWWNC